MMRKLAPSRGCSLTSTGSVPPPRADARASNTPPSQAARVPYRALRMSVRSPTPPPSDYDSDEQQLPDGECILNPPGDVLVPLVITVEPGENIVSKIYEAAEERKRGVCVLSGNGAVSKMDLLRPGSDAPVTYEGSFELLSLSGSSVPEGNAGSTHGLSVLVIGQDNQMFGGGVASLIAQYPVQVVLSSFKPG